MTCICLQSCINFLRLWIFECVTALLVKRNLKFSQNKLNKLDQDETLITTKEGDLKHIDEE